MTNFECHNNIQLLNLNFTGYLVPGGSEETGGGSQWGGKTPQFFQIVLLVSEE